MYKEIEGDIFSTGASAIVNPCNCEGIMEDGLALKFRKLYPTMYSQFKELCKDKAVSPGNIVIYRKCSPMVLTVAAKRYAADPYRIEIIEACLNRLAQNFWRLNLTSVAMPLIRPSIKFMSDKAVLHIMRQHLEGINLDVTVYTNVVEPEWAEENMGKPQRAAEGLAA